LSSEIERCLLLGSSFLRSGSVFRLSVAGGMSCFSTSELGGTRGTKSKQYMYYVIYICTQQHPPTCNTPPPPLFPLSSRPLVPGAFDQVRGARSCSGSGDIQATGQNQNPKHELLARLKVKSSQYAPRPVFFCACVGMSLVTSKRHFRSNFFAPRSWWSCSATSSGKRPVVWQRAESG
jgi:hypothetical protein